MTINCKGKLIDLSAPKVMGILNITPDSFYDGGKYKNDSEFLSQVYVMLKEGATFIDIGAYSSRPNAAEVTESEELKRALPIVELLIKEFPEIIISIDTFRSAVAKEAIESGAAIVNDISSGILDDKMIPTVAQLQVPYIMMHMRGNPQTMMQQTQYNNLIEDITFYFSERLSETRKAGIVDTIIDPGFGFAKTMEQNYELLNHLELFTHLDRPILVGLSRKSMIYKLLESSADQALNGTSILNTIALQKQANILRVHDVKEAFECITLLHQLSR
ncbi:dihydropteroate synthase [Hanstruepera neustonica]|uniref:Dihydropteroate synthase n=1 Tax=Hanstruepera neustonica TaxID=1445657 RepID=A0A2K1DZD9_9FLAO|nr:dihydropteroate synthase [Hanstruepera neustonica]PNQ73402.1 dihydropteroate synthase [Hanstruepera neustonica]